VQNEAVKTVPLYLRPEIIDVISKNFCEELSQKDIDERMGWLIRIYPILIGLGEKE
jgi:hypothetical protein